MTSTKAEEYRERHTLCHELPLSGSGKIIRKYYDRVRQNNNNNNSCHEVTLKYSTSRLSKRQNLYR